MIDVVGEIFSRFGLYAGAGVGLAYVGIWLRRAQKVALWFKLMSVLLVLTGVGAIAGVVDLGRLLELLRMAWEVIGSI